MFSLLGILTHRMVLNAKHFWQCSSMQYNVGSVDRASFGCDKSLRLYWWRKEVSLKISKTNSTTSDYLFHNTRTTEKYWKQNFRTSIAKENDVKCNFFSIKWKSPRLKERLMKISKSNLKVNTFKKGFLIEHAWWSLYQTYWKAENTMSSERRNMTTKKRSRLTIAFDLNELHAQIFNFICNGLWSTRWHAPRCECDEFLCSCRVNGHAIVEISFRGSHFQCYSKTLQHFICPHS